MMRYNVAMQAAAQLESLTQHVNKTLAASQKQVAGNGQATFLEQLQELAASVETKEAGAKEPSEMTMEEYQAYIWDKIESFPFHPSRPNDEEIIKISDKCWERMKNDSSYEEKMMSMIRDGRQVADPFYSMGSPGVYWVLEFDGGEGCYSHGWSKTFGGSATGARKRFEDAKTDDSYITRAKKRKLQKELDELYYEKQRAIKEINQEIQAMRATNAQNVMNPDMVKAMPIRGVPAEFLLAGLGMGK